VGETAGFIKVVVDADTDELLGMHMLAHMAADLLPRGALAMCAGSIDPLRASVYTHPTLSEGVKAAVGNLT
jgi:dihydrolipoamide dehydrogenase